MGSVALIIKFFASLMSSFLNTAMKSLTDFVAVLIFLTFSELTVLLVSFMVRVVYTHASRCMLIVTRFLTVYYIRKSELDTHVVILFVLTSDTCFCAGFFEPLGQLVSRGSVWMGLSGWRESVGRDTGSTFPWVLTS